MLRRSTFPSICFVGIKTSMASRGCRPDAFSGKMARRPRVAEESDAAPKRAEHTRMTADVRSRQFAVGIPALAFVLLAVVTFVIFAASALFEGVGIAVFSDPVGWLSRFDHD